MSNEENKLDIIISKDRYDELCLKEKLTEENAIVIKHFNDGTKFHEVYTKNEGMLELFYTVNSKNDEIRQLNSTISILKRKNEVMKENIDEVVDKPNWIIKILKRRW